MIRRLLTLSLLAALPLAAADKKPAEKDKQKDKDKGKEKAKVVEGPRNPNVAEFVEPDFPFYSSVLDAREAGEGFPKDNLTPRGLILNLGHDMWACFDTDLLRLSCVWQAPKGQQPVTPEALAPGSYHIAGQKTKDGQDFLPKPVGKVWLANGVYPGWQVGEKPVFTDPREASASKEEVGRGALKAGQGSFKSVALPKDRPYNDAVLEYAVGQTRIQESYFTLIWEGKVLLKRQLLIAPHKETLLVACASNTSVSPGQISVNWNIGPSISATFDGKVKQESGVVYVAIPPATLEQSLSLQLDLGIASSSGKGAAGELSRRPKMHWPQSVTTSGKPATPKSAYVADVIDLPFINPWKRNVRIADIAFLNDQGDAAVVAFDGDVWMLSGLKDDLQKVTWKRFTSGLHEPMSIVYRPAATAPSPISNLPSSGEALFVFDRNGIWKLVDTDKDGEADVHEMFCNLFTQTAETREFPNSMKLGPDGSLYISKGGQEGSTYGKDNGTVIKVAPDGKSYQVVGYGLRQPFIGVNPKTGLVTASDQQGNYVPSTPIQIISDHHFYGHLPTIAPADKFPETITEPLTWIPHPVNPSGATQVWLTDAKLGPINDELLHIGYNRPEIFRVLMNSRFQRPQAAVMSFWRELDFGPLNAHVNPADGQLYVIGFQVWGTTAKQLSGLMRIRYTGEPRVLLKEVTPTDKGILLRFNAKLDPKLATDPASFSAERWNYKRTPDYGSPHLKLDGSTGQEWQTPSSAYLSTDGMSVLVGIPEMKAGVHQMRIGWGLKSADGHKAENTAYFSPWELLRFDAVKEGFGDIQVDLTPRKAASVATVKATVEEGARLYQMIGCMACHSIDGSTVGKVGPSWKGLYGSEREIAKGDKGKFKADDAYLRESITNPSAKVVKGFEKFDTGMPIYAGILNDSQIESLILYIKSLK